MLSKLPAPALVLSSYLCGSLPFSVWLVRIARRADVRSVGDGNPGATNAFKAGGAGVGMLALLLDVSKGVVPTAISYVHMGQRGLPMFCIAMAPLLGHAFSPFLRFRGGKALATTLGVWIGLTWWRVSVPIVLLVLFWNAIFDLSGWAVLATLAGMFTILALWMPDRLWLAVLAGQMIILGWTHRADLRRRPHLRPWLARRLSS